MNMIVLFLIFTLLSGCSSNIAHMISENKLSKPKFNVENSQALLISECEKEVLIKIGADISQDKKMESIGGFEELAGEHDIYADEIYIDESLAAEKFILKCFAKGKTPYIILKDRQELSEDEFIRCLEEFETVLDKYPINVMIEVFENSYYTDPDGEKYKLFFDIVSNDSVSVGWSLDYDDIMFFDNYVPDENVDFVCINGYLNSDNDAKRFIQAIEDISDYDIVARFGYIYYSAETCKYTIDEMIRGIENIYGSIKDIENISAIIYMDKNYMGNDQSNYNDYTITSENRILEKYKTLIYDIRYDEGDDRFVE